MDTTTPLKIKALVDENGEYFSPVIAAESMYTTNGKPYETELNNKLEAVNLISSDSVTITKDGKDCTFEVNFGATDNIIDNLDTTVAGQGPLDARQGNVLKNLIPGIVDNLTTNDASKTLSARQGVELKKIAVPTGGSAGQVLKKATDANHSLEWGDAADPNAIVGDGSIMKIIELTYAEYKTLESNGELKEDTEYHITDVENGTVSYKTEAQIQEQINNSIKTKLDLRDPIFLTDGTDLNTISLPGTYRSIATANTATMTNLPTGQTAGFTLFVCEDAGKNGITNIRQELIRDSKVYIRYTNDAGANWSSWEVMAHYQIGDILITSTNTNPGGRMGGTWQLIKREFAYRALSEADGTKNMFVPNTTNVSGYDLRVMTEGDCLRMRLYIVTAVDIADEAVELGTFNWAAVGISDLKSALFGIPMMCDGGNGLFNCYLNIDGKLEARDILNKYANTSMAAGSAGYLSITIMCGEEEKLDSVCNKFFWKRTA